MNNVIWANNPHLLNYHLGESILFCREAEKTKVEQLISSELEPVSSCLIQENGGTLCSSMKRAILEVSYQFRILNLLTK